METKSEPLQLDLKGILKKRVSQKVMRRIPDLALTGLERLIHQDELNEILRETYPSEGAEFSRKVLDFMDIKVDVEGAGNMTDRRSVFASNHPLGGLDGIALIALLGERYGEDGFRFLVNDMLVNVGPLAKVFLPVNKFGGQGRDTARLVREAYESDRQIAVFPAGLVSRRQRGGIRDLEWKKTFVARALDTDRDIVPVRFIGENSGRFYSTAHWRKKLRIKFNVEQILLPGELCRARGSRFRIIIGKPIPASRLRETGKSPAALAEAVQRIVYSLGE